MRRVEFNLTLSSSWYTVYMVKVLAMTMSLLIMVWVWMPVISLAEDPAVEALQQNVAVAYTPPQASAEALLTLPTVYVLPGSFLYWFKHVYEEIQLVFASDPQDRSALLLKFSRARLAEGYQALGQENWSAATESFKEYQQTQEEVAQLLADLQSRKKDVTQLLDQLKAQLGVQQAIDQFSQKHAPQSKAKEIGALLKIRPAQTLALAVNEGGALLGSQDERQASQSAQVTPSAQASASGEIQ